MRKRGILHELNEMRRMVIECWKELDYDTKRSIRLKLEYFILLGMKSKRGERTAREIVGILKAKGI